MAKCMVDIQNLPYEKMEKVLKGFEKEMIPLEIDSKVYFIEMEVSELIDQLMKQLQELRKEKNEWKSEPLKK